MEDNFQTQIKELKDELEQLKKSYREHLHTGLDGTDILKKGIELENDQYLKIGLGGMGTGPIVNTKFGDPVEQLQFAIAVGRDDGKTRFSNRSKNMQMNFLHQPNNPLKQSFLECFRDGIIGPVSITAGQKTASITSLTLTTNEYANAVVNIYDSNEQFIESKIISSNTSNQITISSTWANTVSGGFFEIFFPVFLGSANKPYARNYVSEGVGGGIRFGIGTTAGGSNGLLYMDSAGDIYWRNKSGTSTKLN